MSDLKHSFQFNVWLPFSRCKCSLTLLYVCPVFKLLVNQNIFLKVIQALIYMSWNSCYLVSINLIKYLHVHLNN